MGTPYCKRVRSFCQASVLTNGEEDTELLQRHHDILIVYVTTREILIMRIGMGFFLPWSHADRFPGPIWPRPPKPPFP